jgi:mRNA interferase MazF
MNKFERGDIWLISLDPTVGSEIKKTRPAIIISRTDFNQISKTLTVIPISSGSFIPGIHVPIAHLKKDDSHAITPQIRIASKERLQKKLGKVSASELREIEQQLTFYLDLVEA